MRSVLRSTLGGVVAVLAIGALAATSASAHEFIVEGKPLSGSEAFTGSGGPVTFKGKLFGAPVKWTCKQTASNGNLLSAGKVEYDVEFKECALAEPTGCKLTNSEESRIGYYASGQLGEEEGTTPTLDHWGVGGSELLGDIYFEKGAGECGIPLGGYAIFGSWSCELPNAKVQQISHEEECKQHASNLRMGAYSAGLSYMQTIRLTSGKAWRVV